MTHPQRVITESEKVAKDLKQLEFRHHEFPLNYWDNDEIAVLVKFIMHQKNDDYYRGQKGGVLEGYKRVIPMLEALAEKAQSYEVRHIGSNTMVTSTSTVKAIPLTELQAVITALKKETEQPHEQH